MANRMNNTNKPLSATGPGGLGRAVHAKSVADQAPPDSGGRRDDSLDEELNRERLEPGLNAEGTGGAGANPAKPKDGNRNA